MRRSLPTRTLRWRSGGLSSPQRTRGTTVDHGQEHPLLVDDGRQLVGVDMPVPLAQPGQIRRASRS
jgi:hypothetical protein